MDDCLSVNIREIDPEGWGLWKKVLGLSWVNSKALFYLRKIVLKMPNILLKFKIWSNISIKYKMIVLLLEHSIQFHTSL